MGLCKLKNISFHIKQRSYEQSHETGRASSCRFHRNKHCPTLLKVHVKGMSCALNSWNTDALTITGEMAQWSRAWTALAEAPNSILRTFDKGLCLHCTCIIPYKLLLIWLQMWKFISSACQRDWQLLLLYTVILSMIVHHFFLPQWLLDWKLTLPTLFS